MILYRISNCKHAKDVSGTGAKLFGGRWNSVGTPMLYMAESRALAALEVLANKNSMNYSKNLCLTIFNLPKVDFESVEIKSLPDHWKTYPAPMQLQKIGDSFIRENKFLLLKVPSAIIDGEFNFIMNPFHHLASEMTVLEVSPFSFDSRLLNQ
nr:RES family NAD+ phosphorylase [Pedobacter sp. ASV2]